MSVRDLLSFRLVTDVQLSPDGRQIAFVVRRADEDRDDDESNLWLISADGGAPRQLTFDSGLTRAPRWANDSRRIAFLSSRSGSSQIYLLHLQGGEARQGTRRGGGAGIPAWAPDRERVAFSASVTPQGDANAPKVVDRAYYKSDGVGFLLRERMHLFVIGLAGEARQITDGPCDHLGPAWSPDGKRLVFARAREGARDGHLNDIWTCAPDGSDARKLTAKVSSAASAVWSPDGTTIASLG